MASFLKTLNSNLVFWIDGCCNSDYNLYNYSPKLNLIEQPTYTFNWNLGNSIGAVNYRSEYRYRILSSQETPYYTIYNEKNNLSAPIGAAALAKNYHNFYFNYPLVNYAIEVNCNVGDFFMYSEKELASMDFTMFTLISSQTSGGFKINATSNNINDYIEGFKNFYETSDSNIFTDNKSYTNLNIKQYGISKYPSLKPRTIFNFVFTSEGKVYVGGKEILQSNILYSNSGGTINDSIKNNYFNLILGNWSASTSNKRNINYYMTPGWPGTIYYIKLYKSLNDEQCKLLSRYGSTVELSSDKKLYTPSRLTEKAIVNAFGKNGRIECKNEIIEGKSSQIGFHSNGDLWVDEFIEI